MIVATGASLTMASTVSAQQWYANLAPETAGATGSGSAFFSLSGSMLSINANWSGLTGITSAAHIHCCTADPNIGTAGVAVTPGTLPGFPIGVSAGVYNFTVNLGLASSFTNAFLTSSGGTPVAAKDALVAGFGTGQAYFNIHTSVFPGGEIRGFIREVPEPSALLLTMLAMTLLAGAALRRRAH
jgi:hypothetical protein